MSQRRVKRVCRVMRVCRTTLFAVFIFGLIYRSLSILVASGSTTVNQVNKSRFEPTGWIGGGTNPSSFTFTASTLSCPVYPDTGPHICTTDPDHGRNTGRNNFLYGTHFLILGFLFICHAVLMFLLTLVGCPLYIKDIFNPDKQDDGAARRLFTDILFSFLVDSQGNLIHPSLEGLFILTFVFGELFDAWMKRSMPHMERVVCVFRARHFLTIWRSNIVNAETRYPDLFQKQSSFLADQSFQIFMRLCDQFILLTLAHLEYYPEIPFMPWHHGTHFLEHFYGIARSFITDFSFGQFIEMYKHILIRQRILSSGQYTTKKEKDSNNGYSFDFVDSGLTPEDIAALKYIPSRADIDRACETAWNEAAALASQFAKMQIPALPLQASDLHPQFRTANGQPKNAPAEPECDEEEIFQEIPFGLDARASESGAVRVGPVAPSATAPREYTPPGSSLSFAEALAHASHHIITEQYLADEAEKSEAELVEIEEELANNPHTSKTISGRMLIANLLNPVEHPPAPSLSAIPTFLVAQQPILRSTLVEQRIKHCAETRVHSEAAREPATDEVVQQSEGLRGETVFQKGRYNRWIATGAPTAPTDWTVGCRVRTALRDIVVPNIDIRGVDSLNVLRLDSVVMMRTLRRIYLGKVRGIYRYGSVSGKHDSFTEAETVNGLSYLSVEVWPELGGPGMRE